MRNLFKNFILFYFILFSLNLFALEKLTNRDNIERSVNNFLLRFATEDSLELARYNSFSKIYNEVQNILDEKSYIENQKFIFNPIKFFVTNRWQHPLYTDDFFLILKDFFNDHFLKINKPDKAGIACSRKEFIGTIKEENNKSTYCYSAHPLNGKYIKTHFLRTEFVGNSSINYYFIMNTFDYGNYYSKNSAYDSYIFLSVVINVDLISSVVSMEANPLLVNNYKKISFIDLYTLRTRYSEETVNPVKALMNYNQNFCKLEKN